MKTNMKVFIMALALTIGCVGLSKAGGRQGQGWNVTVVTGTVATIGEGRRIYLKGVYLSSGTTTSLGDYLVVMSTVPSTVNGGGLSLMPHNLFLSTTAVTPSIVFHTTTTANGGTNLNNKWEAGDCDECYVEIPGSSTQGGAGGALHIRKSAEASGGANVATVLWSN